MPSTTLHIHTLAALTLILAPLATSCTQAHAPKPPLTSSTPPPQSLLVPPYLPQEASFFAESIAQAHQMLAIEFGPAIAQEVQKAQLSIYVHAFPNALADHGLATCITHNRTEGYRASLHFLALSSHQPGMRTSLNGPMDSDYMRKLIVHELSTLYLELSTTTKPQGWTFFTAPGWFIQGSQEYLGIQSSAKAAKNWALLSEKMRQCLAPDADPKPRCNDYVQGPLKIKYLVETYGTSALHELLKSPSPTFQDAFETVLHVNPETFEAKWQQWLSKAPR